MTLFYQCGPTKIVDNTATRTNYLAPQKTIVIDVDNAVDEPQVTDPFMSQLTPLTSETVTNSPLPVVNASLATALDEPKSVTPQTYVTTHSLETTHNQTSSTESQLKITPMGASNLFKATSNVTSTTSSEKAVSTKTPATERLESSSTKLPTNENTSHKPVTQSNPPKAAKRKKVPEGSEITTKKYSPKKTTKSPSEVQSKTTSSWSSTASEVPRKSVSPHLTRRKNINKVVVGQNELVFDSNERSTIPSSNYEITRQMSREKPTTISALLGMIEEVAYDKRKSILKS